MQTLSLTPGQVLAAIVGRIMNGEALPAPDSAEFQNIERNVGAILRASPDERERFGVLVLGHLIDAARAHLKTAEVLRNFGRSAFE